MTIDMIEFEGIEWWGRGVIKLLFMTVWKDNEKIWSGEVMGIASKRLLKDIVSNAVQNDYILKFKDDAEKIIGEESE